MENKNYWIHDEDFWKCSICGFETDNPHIFLAPCPRCGFKNSASMPSSTAAATPSACPFCNSTKLKIDSKSKFISYRHVRTYTFSVRCNSCHARGPTVSGECAEGTRPPQSKNLTTLEEIEKRAIAVWDRRALRV